MADGGSIVIAGLEELRSGIQQLPDQVTAALMRVASATAQRVLMKARANLKAQTHGTGATAAAMLVRSDVANKMFVVESPGAPFTRLSLHTMKRSGRSHTQKVTVNMVPIYLEYGTRSMSARPYLRPAVEAEQARYRSDMEAAALAPVRALLEK